MWTTCEVLSPQGAVSEHHLTALITVSTDGIGLQAARELAQGGRSVILGGALLGWRAPWTR
ncbi:MAG: hypothetical protein JXX28_19985 [Deltaproteobacteria bacterium]|nr:hypothetical protein [Deltaproteobacteria bacterium]